MAQEFPEAGCVEMDPCLIYKTCVECVEKACAKLEEMGISKEEIKSIGIANQRETTIVWDSKTGRRKFILNVDSDIQLNKF